MKKILSLLLAMTIVASLSACAKSAPPPASSTPAASGASADAGANDKEVTLKLGLTFNLDDYRGQDVEYFTKLVEERSGGKIKFELFPGEQLVQGKESLQGVSQGIIDMYMVGSSYIVGLVPSVTVCDLPKLVSRDFTETLQLTYDLMEGDAGPIYEEQFQKAGVELVGAIAQSGGTEMIFSKPVRTMEDYAGRKVRTVGGVSDQILLNLNATPVFIGSADVYLGLQTGVVDGSMTTASTILSNKLYELCPYLVEPTLGSSLSPYFLIINDKRWAALSDNQREIMRQAAKDTLARTVEVYPELLNKQREEALACFDEVITLSDEEFARVSEKGIEPVWDDILKDADDVTKQIADIRRELENRR